MRDKDSWGCATRPQAGRATRNRRNTKSGLTLYEVILALAIFLPALVILGQCLSQGRRAAVSARLQTQAVLRCDSALSEVMAGLWPMKTTTEEQLFEDGAAGWVWMLSVAQGPHPNTLLVQVAVEHRDSNGTSDASYTLTRLVRNPQLFADAALLPQPGMSPSAMPPQGGM